MTEALPPPYTSLSLLHESVLMNVASSLGLGAKVSLQCTNRDFQGLGSSARYWASIDLRKDQVAPALLLHCLGLARGAVQRLLITCEEERQQEAAAQESVARFGHGLRYYEHPPFTLGRWAERLAALIPNIQELCIDESTSPLGGMTDDFAKAIAAGCERLERLEVRFSKGSMARFAAERFTDEGLSAIAERCSNLKALVLRQCSGITDCALYAMAANCQGLRELHLSGYSEQISDSGLVLLLSAAAPTLVTCHLSSKLFRVTDAAALALLRPQDQQQGVPVQSRATQAQASTHDGHPSAMQVDGTRARGAPELQNLKLGRNATDAVLDALRGMDSSGFGGSECPASRLQRLHIAKCPHVTATALLGVIASGACPGLTRVRVSKALAAELSALSPPGQLFHVDSLQQGAAVDVVVRHVQPHA